MYQTGYASMAKACAMGIALSSPSLVSRHIYSNVRVGFAFRDGQRRRNGEKKKYTYGTHADRYNANVTASSLPWCPKRPCISGMPLSLLFVALFVSTCVFFLCLLCGLSTSLNSFAVEFLSARALKNSQCFAENCVAAMIGTLLVFITLLFVIGGWTERVRIPLEGMCFVSFNTTNKSQSYSAT